MIRSLVDTFYARVRRDPLLGPVFDRAIEDWGAHLDKLCASGNDTGTFGALAGAVPGHGEEDMPARAGRDFHRPRQPDRRLLRLGIALHRGEGVVLPVLPKARPVKEA